MWLSESIIERESLRKRVRMSTSVRLLLHSLKADPRQFPELEVTSREWLQGLFSKLDIDIYLITKEIRWRKRVIYFVSDWPTVQRHLKEHPDFDSYFYKCDEEVICGSDGELDWQEDRGKRIPCHVLESGEAESVFKSHASALQQEQKKME